MGRAGPMERQGRELRAQSNSTCCEIYERRKSRHWSIFADWPPGRRHAAHLDCASKRAAGLGRRPMDSARDSTGGLALLEEAGSSKTEL